MANIQAAKVSVVLDQPFFGSLICHLKFQEDSTCDTAWTDGTSLGYNPSFIASLGHAECVGLLVHEVMHCAALHPYRRDARDPEQWNIACDIAINPLIQDAGCSLPEGSLQPTDPSHKGKSAEWLFDRLPKKTQGGSGSGSGSGQGNGKPAPGEVRDAPTPGQSDPTGQSGQGNGQPQSEQGPDSNSASDWKEHVRQATTMAKMRGTGNGNLDRFAKDTITPTADLFESIMQFAQRTAKDDYSWSKVSTRYAAMDIYLPGLQSDEFPEMAVAIDTSGSMDNVALERAKGVLMRAVDELQPRAVTVYYADACVAGSDRFEKGDDIVFRPKGGGGTDFRPVFDAIAKQDETPVCLVYVTDMYGSFPEFSDIPTLWVTDTANVKAPFGETARINY